MFTKGQIQVVSLPLRLVSLIMPQRPRKYRKRQQDSDEEEQEGVVEGGAKETEEDLVRCVLLLL